MGARKIDSPMTPDEDESGAMVPPLTMPTLAIIHPPVEPIAEIVQEDTIGGVVVRSITCVWADKEKPTCGGICPAGSCTFIEGHGVCSRWDHLIRGR